MFSETCLKYKYRSLLQPLPILELSPKTFQSSLWLRKAQSEEIFINQDQDQHPRQQVAPPSASGQPRNYTGTSDIDYIQDFINQAFSLTGQSVFIHKKLSCCYHSRQVQTA